MFALTILGYTIAAMWFWIFLVIYVLFALWPARVAARKGYSGLLFFIISLPWFFITLVIAYLLPDKSKQAAAQSTPTAPTPPAAQ